ncbi:MAG: V-type ATP synthase subunit A, partial [Myxococcota bacterium]
MTTNDSSPEPAGSGASSRAPVVGVKESLVTIDVSDTPVMKNEVGYVCVGDERLKAEVLRVQGDVADMQVFEETIGVKVGDEVELSGEMLSATLGPGLLGQVFDGLQVPLDVVAASHGFFLPRGANVPAVNLDKEWKFEPREVVGTRLVAGQAIGVTPEGPFEHRIMVPFDERDPVELIWVRSGSAKANDCVARLKRPDGSEREVTLVQTWPVRRALPENMLTRRFAERLYPDEPITTTQRIIDTFLPLARGGTGCIPGPFGAGKTVLQSCIARYSTVDIV